MDRLEDGIINIDNMLGPLDAVPVFDSLYDLRNNELILDTPVFVKRYSDESMNGGGLYYPQPNDHISTDDDGMIIVDKSNSRWLFSGFTTDEEGYSNILQLKVAFPGELVLFPEIYGASGCGYKDDTDAFLKLFKTINLLGKGILYIKNQYLLEREHLDLPENIIIVSNGVDNTFLEKISNKKNSYTQIENFLRNRPQIILGNDICLKAKQSVIIENLILSKKNYCHDRDYNGKVENDPIQLNENTQYRITNLYKIGFNSEK